uniref:Topo homolgy domain in CRISPR-associated endonuclease Cas9 n=1 Tax=Siphoviridae sp. ctmpG14 TaxID=2825654 RepID=A0A8S5PC04_9CAUD|nr:MAG TPA: Topo homolgy domain in CRISPR-associated endonuclease Cas9 [Siphoviridae sp. ctmpG14]
MKINRCFNRYNNHFLTPVKFVSMIKVYAVDYWREVNLFSIPII